MDFQPFSQPAIVEFGERVEQYLRELEIFEETLRLQSDHIGLRMRDIAAIESLKQELHQNGSILLSSAIVNGREIDIFKLSTPLSVHGWAIPCIELPYPKPDHDYPNGWEHIEFVIPSSATTPDALREDFLRYFPNIDIDLLKQTGQYSEAEPISETHQLPNPTITLRKDKRTAVKFHAKPIEMIVIGTL
jgi:predicted metalloenzyme YecM